MSAELNSEGLWEQTIDGKVYEFQKWGAEDSLKTLLKLGKIAGKPFGMLLSAVLDGKDPSSLLGKGSPDLNGDLLGKAFEALTESLDEDQCFLLLKKLSSDKVMCDRAPIKSFDQHYRENLDHMFKVAKAALEVQYGSFFGALLGGVNLAGKRRPSIPAQ